VPNKFYSKSVAVSAGISIILKLNSVVTVTNSEASHKNLRKLCSKW